MPFIPTTRSPQEASLARRLQHRTVVLAVVLLAQLMVVLDTTVVNVALPPHPNWAGLFHHQPLMGHQRLRPCLRRVATSRRPGR